MQTKEGQPRGEGPRSIFRFGDTQVDIFKALDNGETDISTSNRRPGDAEAQALLRWIGNFRMNSDDYRRATPEFFAMAARPEPEGGYDRDLLALIYQEIDEAYKEVNKLPPRDSDPRHINRNRFWAERDTMLIALSRAHGHVEAIKAHIWDNPKMKDEKQKIVASARQNMRAHHSHLPDPDDPDPEKTANHSD